MTLLEVQDLQIHFPTRRGIVKAVNGVHFSIRKGEIMGLVGESGSGKSITGLSLMGLIPRPGKMVHGNILLEGTPLHALREKEWKRIRGKDVAMIFQNPLTALDPMMTIGRQMSETIRYRQQVSTKEAWRESEKMLELVGIHDPGRVMKSYPHSLSGGMRQRVMIAMAISCRPKLLIADEPTTALDATIQKQILALLKKINREMETSILMITHDFSVVSSLCDTVAVMYAGYIVESGDAKKIILSPEHPYTKGLIGSVPKLDLRTQHVPKRLPQIDGFPPDLLNLPGGCSFADRCPEVHPKCLERVPLLVHLEQSHQVRCINREEQSNVSAS